MRYKESEKIELKKSTAELKEAVISIAAMLNKHGQAELFFGINDNGKVSGMTVGRKTFVIFYRPNLEKRKNSKKNRQKSSPKTRDKIIDLITQNNNITIEIIANTIGITKRAVLKQVDKLKKERILERVGSAKGGYWKISY